MIETAVFVYLKPKQLIQRVEVLFWKLLF